MFTKETYIKRRASIKEQITNGICLFLGNNESPMNYPDNTYHFRQDSTFLYYFGMDYPDLFGIIDTDSGEEILFGDDLSIDSIVWMGAQPTLAERAVQYGIPNVQPLAKLNELLAQARNQGRKIHYLPPYRHDNKIQLFKWLDIHPDKLNEHVSKEFIVAVVEQRAVKSAEEITEIHKAVDITADMHIEAMKYIRPGMTEAEVAAKVHQIALAANGNISFPIIATINGQTLHNHYHGNTIKEGDLFLLDAGAETELHYSGDMSSTIPVSKKFSARQLEIYNVALNSHEAAIAALKPGVAFKDIHLTAARSIINDMKSLGFMKGDTEEALAAGAHALFFPCGLGHMMGLDVHDMEDLGEVYVGYEGKAKSTQFGLKSLRLARPLKPGFVLTIEPGIYFIPELIDLWKSNGHNAAFYNFDKIEQYKDFGGIRNEEDFVITEQGAELLGKPIPKKPEDVEALR